MTENSSYLSSVTNALKILKSFTTAQPVKHVNELARELNVSKSTASRLVKTLVKEEFLRPDDNSLGYRLGYSLLTLGGTLANTNELYREIAPILNDIVLQTGESAHVAVLEGTEIIYLQKNIGPYYANINTQIGSHNPSHATSSGKVLLSEVNPEIVDNLFEKGVKAYTEYTIVNPLKFHLELSKIRKQGYAISLEEVTLNNYSLAVPVRNNSGIIVCAIVVVGPLSRINKGKTTKFIEILKKAALDASERLGYEE